MYIRKSSAELMANEAVERLTQGNYDPTNKQLFKRLKSYQIPTLRPEVRKLFKQTRDILNKWGYLAAPICPLFYSNKSKRIDAAGNITTGASFSKIPPTNIQEGQICIPGGTGSDGKPKRIAGLHFPNNTTLAHDWILLAYTESMASVGTKTIGKGLSIVSLGVLIKQLKQKLSIDPMVKASDYTESLGNHMPPQYQKQLYSPANVNMRNEINVKNKQILLNLSQHYKNSQL